MPNFSPKNMPWFECKNTQKVWKTQDNATDLSINAFDLINIAFVLTDIDAVLTSGRHSLPFRTAPSMLLLGTSSLLPSTCFAVNQKKWRRNSVLPSVNALCFSCFQPASCLKNSLVINFFALIAYYLADFVYLCNVFRKECRHNCSIASQSPPWEYEQYLL